MANVGTLDIETRLRTERLEQGVRKANSTLARMEKKALNVGRAMGGLVGAATIAGLAAMTKSALTAADAIAKTSDKIGISTAALQELRYAASQTGVSTQTLEMALQRMTRRVAEAAQGTGEAKAAIAELGLNAQELARLSPDEAFRRLSTAMEGVANQGDRVRLAMKLFDSEGVALVNTMRGGAEQLDQFSQTARELGLVLDESLIRNAEKTSTQFDALGTVITTNLSAAVLELAPQLESIASGFLTAARAAREFFTATDQSALKMAQEIQELYEKRAEKQREIAEFQGSRIQRILRTEEGFQSELNRKREQLVRIEDELNTRIQQRTALLDRDRKAQEQLDAAIAPKAPATPVAAPGAASTASGKTSTPKATTERISEAQRLIDTLTRERDTLGLTEDQLLRYEAAQVIATDATAEQQAAINQLVEQIILERAVLEDAAEATDKLSTEFEAATSEMSAYAEEAARNIQDAFADFLFDPFSDGLDGMLDGFIQTVRRMAAEQLSSQILDQGGLALATSSNGFLSSIGSFFGGGKVSAVNSALDSTVFASGSGLFADGGIMTGRGPAKLKKYASGGIANSPQISVFGEAGPEAYVPLPDGRRIPVAMQGGGAGVTINVSTPDASSFRRSRSAIAADVSRGLAVAGR